MRHTGNPAQRARNVDEDALRVCRAEVKVFHGRFRRQQQGVDYGTRDLDRLEKPAGVIYSALESANLLLHWRRGAPKHHAEDTDAVGTHFQTQCIGDGF